MHGWNNFIDWETVFENKPHKTFSYTLEGNTVLGSVAFCVSQKTFNKIHSSLNFKLSTFLYT